MAVRFTEGFGTYWNYMVHNFTKGDVVPSGELANYLLDTGAPVERVDVEPVEPKRRTRRTDS